MKHRVLAFLIMASLPYLNHEKTDSILGNGRPDLECFIPSDSSASRNLKQVPKYIIVELYALRLPQCSVFEILGKSLMV